MRAIIGNTGMGLAEDLEVATTLFARMKGLLGRDVLLPGQGLWIKPCMGVHTFGMRFPIDVLVLDLDRRVVAIVQDLRPNRMTALYRRGNSVVELPAGAVREAKVNLGDSIEFAY